ncbi:hypothetical protein COLO4_03594 [Corchorus olitorius]|uniref:Uncharacterized protein n=1 Tax=Corchorus olitorius TaxID=93759 RepID=A0A1R3KY14_9ROSI|nr:hypothetical protein COLO4_03594 [Corchorus olitorius]
MALPNSSHPYKIYVTAQPHNFFKDDQSLESPLIRFKCNIKMIKRRPNRRAPPHQPPLTLPGSPKDTKSDLLNLSPSSSFSKILSKYLDLHKMAISDLPLPFSD